MRQSFTTKGRGKGSREIAKATMLEKATIETNEVLAGLLNHTYMTRLLPIPCSRVSSSPLTMAGFRNLCFHHPRTKKYMLQNQVSIEFNKL